MIILQNMVVLKIFLKILFKLKVAKIFFFLSFYLFFLWTNGKKFIGYLDKFETKENDDKTSLTLHGPSNCIMILVYL